jgi:hypothetical protein
MQLFGPSCHLFPEWAEMRRSGSATLSALLLFHGGARPQSALTPTIQSDARPKVAPFARTRTFQVERGSGSLLMSGVHDET